MKKRALDKHNAIDANKRDKIYCRTKQKNIGFVPYCPRNGKLKRRRKTSFSIGVRLLISRLTSF